jgi:hypothetical protein
MKSLIQSLLAITLPVTFASCSCAIYHRKWAPKKGSKIPESSLLDLDTRMKRINKRGVDFYSSSKEITLDSWFCPTPLTLITWGADARAWEARCGKSQATIDDWSTQQGIKLEAVSILAEQVGAE